MRYFSYLLFNSSNNLEFSGGMKTNISLSSYQLNKIVCNVSSSQIYSFNCIFDSVPFKHRRYLSHSISNVNNYSCIFSLCIKGQNCLVFKKECGCSKWFKKYFCYFSSVLVWIQSSLSYENIVILRILYFQFSVDLFPNILHVFSIFNDPVSHRVFKF